MRVKPNPFPKQDWRDKVQQLYGSSKSYLTDVYLTHTAIFGHVYAVDGQGGLPFPSTEKTITKLAERFRQLKVI